VGVYINGSIGLNGFDINLFADSTVLKPAGFDLTGTVLLGAPIVILECLQGRLIIGSTCVSTDVTGTLHFAATSALGSPLTLAPTTGLLFTAIYNVTGTAPVGGISVGFQTGCAQTSVSPNICITISNGTALANVETVATGTLFNNSGNTVPWLAATSNVTVVNVLRSAAVGNHVAVTTTAQNGWPGFSTDSVSFRAVVSNIVGSNPPVTPALPIISPTTCAPAACTITVTVDTANPGTYAVTVYATYTAFDLNGLTVTLVAPVNLVVNVGFVTWTINGVGSGTGQTVYMAKGTGTTNPLPLFFTIQSVGGYTGTITYSTNLLAPGTTGLAFVYPAPFTLAAGQTVTKTINGTATGYGIAAALYSARAVPTGLGNINSATLTVHVTGFSLTTNSTSVSIPP
jgi:hypothetical protein